MGGWPWGAFAWGIGDRMFGSRPGTIQAGRPNVPRGPSAWRRRDNDIVVVIVIAVVPGIVNGGAVVDARARGGVTAVSAFAAGDQAESEQRGNLQGFT